MSGYSSNIFESLKPFEVDIKHLMEDIKEHYSYPIEEAVVVENMDNCIDENYTEIHFNIEGNNLEIIMLGDAFDKEVFWKKLPVIAATTKAVDKGIQALGRYGWGMKVCMFVSEYVIIETKNENFHAAQRWVLHKGIPKWGKIPIGKAIATKYTKIKMKLNREYSKKITPEFVEKTLQKYYPTVLNGAPVKNKFGKKRKIKVYVNSNQAKPPDMPRWEKKEKLKIKVNGEEATGYVFLAKRKLPEEYRGIAVIVHGRVILREFFGIYGSMNDRITGYIHADMLVNYLAGDKTKIKWCGKWRKLRMEISKQLSAFMKKIGAVRSEKLPKKTMKWLHEEINKLIKHIPELQELAVKSSRTLEKKVLIQKNEGKEPAALIEGAQKVPGTEIGPGRGGKVPAWTGNKKIRSPRLDEHGKDRATTVKRKVKVGIEIRPRPVPERSEEAWYAPEGVVIVNTSFPSYKKADMLGFRDYHILRCSIDALLRYALANGIIKVEDYDKYYNYVFAKWGEL